MSNAVPLIFGEVLFDCFEDGSRVLGGAPFNVAWHLQAFGAEPLFVSRVGDDDMGAQIKDEMQRWGMRCDALQLDQQHSTGEVTVTIVDGQPTYDIVFNRAYDLIDASQLPQTTPSLIYHGSLALRAEHTAKALLHLLKSKAPVFMDINLRPPWWDKEQLHQLLHHVKWLKINDEELSLFIDGDDLMKRALALKTRYQFDMIIVTCGADGAFAYNEQNEYFEIKPKPSNQIIDTVGAGDAFASVCIIGLLNQWPVSVMLQRAQQFASLLVEQRGAILKDINLYNSLKHQWQLS